MQWIACRSRWTWSWGRRCGRTKPEAQGSSWPCCAGATSESSFFSRGGDSPSAGAAWRDYSAALMPRHPPPPPCCHPPTSPSAEFVDPVLVARPRRELALARFALQKLYRQVEVGSISGTGGSPSPDVALVPRPHGGPPLLQVRARGALVWVWSSADVQQARLPTACAAAACHAGDGAELAALGLCAGQPHQRAGAVLGARRQSRCGAS